MGRPSGNPALVAAWHVERDRAIRYLVSFFDRLNGNLAAIATETGVDRRSLYRWLAEESKLRSALKAARKK
jgi:hypothetical protein